MPLSAPGTLNNTGCESGFMLFGCGTPKRCSLMIVWLWLYKTYLYIVLQLYGIFEIEKMQYS